jgi:hypothetical protein
MWDIRHERKSYLKNYHEKKKYNPDFS